MELYYLICFFIFGTVFGSFYNVVGWRLPIGQSIVSPPSHCPKCNHRLKIWELIPILSFIFQRGKCVKCRGKISYFYPVFEFSCGMLFALAYLSFGLSWPLLIALTFISMIIIITVSDYHYMIIPDEILIIFGALIAIETLFINGYSTLILCLGNGCVSLVIMLLLKLLGDFLFKKESMGGGDIKLMFVFGMMFGWPMSIVSIFFGSVIGLPISLLLLTKNKDHIIPFGPFLSMGALIILLTKIDFNMISSLLLK